MDIVNKQIEDFIRDLVPKRSELLSELEQQASKENIPIVKPEVAQLLSVLVKLHKPNRILEIGTAIGYSTIWLALGDQGQNNDFQVVTIEKDDLRYKEALMNVEKAKLNSKIELISGDALEVIPTFKEKFDFMFIDAAKGQYLNFFDLCYPLLNPGGLIVTDNVLFRGMVVQEEVDKRYRTMVRKIRKYLETLTEHPELDTSIVPIGDGVAISKKR